MIPMNVARRVMELFEGCFIHISAGCKLHAWREITRNADSGGIRSRRYNYDMWRYVTHTFGNSCEIQRFLDVGMLHSHRFDLCPAFSVRSLCVVYLFQWRVV